MGPTALTKYTQSPDSDGLPDFQVVSEANKILSLAHQWNFPGQSLSVPDVQNSPPNGSSLLKPKLGSQHNVYFNICSIPFARTERHLCLARDSTVRRVIPMEQQKSCASIHVF
jgi:hypothetical protein